MSDVDQADLGDLRRRCKNCRFYDYRNGTCHRRAPTHRDSQEFILRAYLQAIAISAAKLAGVDLSELDRDVSESTTEVYTPEVWPSVKEFEWCGEFEDFEQFPLRRRLVNR